MNGEPKFVTLVSGDSPCRAMDGLADGFMRWLGKERVRLHLLLSFSADIPEFSPFKPVYEWARTGQVTWKVDETELLIISMRSFEKVKEWIDQQKFHCMVATLDVRDKPPDETLSLAPPVSPVQVSFKREMTYTSQSPTVYTCPVGIVPEVLPPLKPYAERSISVSCMVGESNMTRRAMVDVVKTIPGARASLERIDRQEYLKILMDSKIGVACYGGGFDSARYWEIPYCGALLVAQPMPLLIPRNFQAGKHALFYMSPIELLSVIKWALEHPIESEKMAREGTHHLMTNHLTIHRAQYLVSIMRAKAQETVAQETLKNFPY